MAACGRSEGDSSNWTEMPDTELGAAVAPDAAGSPDSRGGTRQDSPPGSDSRAPGTDGAQSAPEPTTKDAASSPPSDRDSPDTNTANTSVRGTIRGSSVDGVVCTSGLEAQLFGPNDASNPDYQLSFERGAQGSCEFQMATPADASTPTLSGWIGAPAREGTYDATTTCGYLRFAFLLPIPSDVFCTTQFAPCDPGCAGVGEMGICQPANPRVTYMATSSASCGASDASPVGGWNLTIASVVAHDVPGADIHNVGHGHLDATLVRDGDASDSAVLSLEF